MRYLCSVIFFLGLMSSAVFAQTDTLNIQQGEVKPALTLEQFLGKLPLRQDARITDMLIRHSQINQKHKGIDGFRLEIFFGSDNKAREKATRVKNEFNLIYPTIPAYVSFQTPNFKVRVGDFRNKSEALKTKAAISAKFPNAFIVKDNIRFPELYTESVEQPEENDNE
ncbi:MAG: SPOR domain-containing protein [Methylococcaceae bacterium]